MGDRILIAYASKCGSTGEVAQAIGQVLCEAGAAVDVRPVAEVTNLAGYRGVIIGSAARMGKSLPEAVKFAEQHRDELSHMMATAYFTVGVTMKQDTPENREKAAAHLQSLCAVREPVSLGLFAGKVDPAKMALPLRVMTSCLPAAKQGPLAPGDFRDWEAIRAWGRALAPSMVAV